MLTALLGWVKREVLRLVARDIYNDLMAAAPAGHLPEEFREEPLALAGPGAGATKKGKVVR